jgi:predicted Ser/Thr protein kinase
VAQVREKWLDLVDAEVQASSGLVDETRHQELFGRYVSHASHAIKRERLYNPVTGKHEEPDADLMQSVEQMLGVDDADAFRGELLGAIAADSIDHPGETVDYARIFPREIDRLKDGFFSERHKQVAEVGEDALLVLDGRAVAEAPRVERAQALLRELYDRHGYEPVTARIALGALYAARYAELRR